MLTFVAKPPLAPTCVAELRLTVGWDALTNKLPRYLSSLYWYAACLESNRLIGFVAVMSDGVMDALLTDLMVHPDYRRRGIATRLGQMAIEQVRSAGIKCVNVLFDPELTPFYQKLGFHIVAGGILDNDPPQQKKGR